MPIPPFTFEEDVPEAPSPATIFPRLVRESAAVYPETPTAPYALGRMFPVAVMVRGLSEAASTTEFWVVVVI